MAYTDNWQEDAARRDFTINAMSCNQAGEIFDYFGGQADLAAGHVRFVGVARQRIQEDYLRILRFFRFLARYGQGAPDAEAMAAIALEAGGLSNLSAERVWSELERIMQAPAPLAAVRLMQQTGVLELVLPGALPERLAALLVRGAPSDPLLRLAALTDEDLAQRLRLSGEEARMLAGWRAPFHLKPGDDDASLRRALADTRREVLLGQSWLYGEDNAAWAALRARLLVAEAPVFPLRGRDLLALGFPAGAGLGEVLAHVRQWWLEGGCVADKTACLMQVDRKREGLKS